jgi:hypothetical protein
VKAALNRSLLPNIPLPLQLLLGLAAVREHSQLLPLCRAPVFGVCWEVRELLQGGTREPTPAVIARQERVCSLETRSQPHLP